MRAPESWSMRGRLALSRLKVRVSISKSKRSAKRTARSIRVASSTKDKACKTRISTSRPNRRASMQLKRCRRFSRARRISKGRPFHRAAPPTLARTSIRARKTELAPYNLVGKRILCRAEGGNTARGNCGAFQKHCIIEAFTRAVVLAFAAIAGCAYAGKK